MAFSIEVKVRVGVELVGVRGRLRGSVTFQVLGTVCIKAGAETPEEDRGAGTYNIKERMGQDKAEEIGKDSPCKAKLRILILSQEMTINII